MKKIDLTSNGRCFACGPDNPIGLHLQFHADGDRIRCEFTPHPDHQGYAGITHGGIIATVLDEAMARLLWDAGRPVVTGSFQMRLRSQARAGEVLYVEAWLESERGRIVKCGAAITGPDGRSIAESSGTYVEFPDGAAERTA